MSYNLAILAPAIPASDDAAFPVVRALLATYGDDEAPPEPVLVRFHAAITKRFPCLSTGAEDSPWSDGPLINNFVGRVGVVGISMRHEEVIPAILDCAAELGLTVVDEQAGKIHRPPAMRVMLRGVGPGQDTPAVAARLVPVMKRTQEQIEALLYGPAIVVKKGLDRDTAQRYVDTLEGMGCTCSIEPDAAPAPVQAAPAPPAPKPAPLGPVSAPAPACDPQLKRVADGQQLAIYAIGLNIALLLARAKFLTPTLFIICAVVVALLSVAAAIRTTRAIGWSWAAAGLTALCSLMPFVNLLVLGIVSALAAAHLRGQGFSVGWLGVSAEDRSYIGQGHGARNWAMLASVVLCVASFVGLLNNMPSSDSLHPCALVGEWRAERTDVVYRVAMDEAGSVLAKPISGNASSIAKITFGTWEARANKIYWQYPITAGQFMKETNDFKMDADQKGLTIYELNGELTRYTLINRGKSTKCGL
ncbi:MAG: hypothetical protein V4463_04670 [Pseudomonadota bacterium]